MIFQGQVCECECEMRWQKWPVLALLPERRFKGARVERPTFGVFWFVKCWSSMAT